MEDIAREMGVSKKTLYSYVCSKTDLIEKILLYSVFIFEEWFNQIEAKNMNAIDELLEISVRMNQEYQKFDSSDVFELKKYYPSIFKKHVEYETKFAYRVALQNIIKGINQGYYRTELDAELTAGLFVQKMISIHSSDFFSQEKLTFDKIFEVMFENHIRGIANESGIAYFNVQKENLKLSQII
jgi:AcrR family transcriptional regulator